MYTNISGSTDYTKLHKLVKFLSLIALMVSASLFVIQYIIHDTWIFINPLLYTSLIVLNLMSMISILQYGKREVVELTRPPKSKKRILGMARVFTRHLLDLILIPTLTLLVILDLYYRLSIIPDLVSMGTIGFTVLTVTQFAPLRFQKDKYARSAHKRISESVQIITISRNMISGLDRRVKKYREYMNKIRQCEEIIRSDSDFLMLSGGKLVSMISALRFLTPALGTVGPLILQLVI